MPLGSRLESLSLSLAIACRRYRPLTNLRGRKKGGKALTSDDSSSPDQGGYPDPLVQWRPDKAWPKPETELYQALLAENGGKASRVMRALKTNCTKYLQEKFVFSDDDALPIALPAKVRILIRLILTGDSVDEFVAFELATLLQLLADEHLRGGREFEALCNRWLNEGELSRSIIGIRALTIMARNRFETSDFDDTIRYYNAAITAIGESNISSSQVRKIKIDHSDLLIEICDLVLAANDEDSKIRCCLDCIDAYIDTHGTYDEELERQLVNLYCVLRDSGDISSAIEILEKVLAQKECHFRSVEREEDLLTDLAQLYRRIGKLHAAAHCCVRLIDLAATFHGDISEPCSRARKLLSEIHADLGNGQKTRVLRALSELNLDRHKARSAEMRSFPDGDEGFALLEEGRVKAARRKLMRLRNRFIRLEGATSYGALLFGAHVAWSHVELAAWNKAEKAINRLCKDFSRAELSPVQTVDIAIEIMDLVEQAQSRRIENDLGLNPNSFNWIVEEWGAWNKKQGLLIKTYSAFMKLATEWLVIRFSRACLWVLRQKDFIGPPMFWRLPLRNASYQLIRSYVYADNADRKEIGQAIDVFHDRWLDLCISIGADREIPNVLAGIQGRDSALTLARRRNLLFGDDEKLSFWSVLWRGLTSALKPFAGKKTFDSKSSFEFDMAIPILDISGPELVKLLKPGEAALLLFEYTEDTGETHVMGSLQSTGLFSGIFAAEKLSEVLRDVKRHNASRHNTRGNRGFRGVAPQGQDDPRPNGVSATTIDVGLAPDFELLMEKTRKALKELWEHVDEEAPTRVYIATHQSTHLLPMNADIKAPFETIFFPGLLFLFGALKQGDLRKPLDLQLSRMYLDDARGTDAPIPFVEVEGRIAQTIWGREAIQLTSASQSGDPEKLLEDSSSGLLIAAHGEERPSEPPESIIWYNRKDGKFLDSEHIFGAPVPSRVVIASACVAGTVRESGFGEPLGLVSAFLTSGSRMVLAPIQPINDLYAPILLGLFHFAWKDVGDAREAWRIACYQASKGKWPRGFERLLEEAYRPVLEDLVKRAGQDPRDLDILRASGLILPREAETEPTRFLDQFSHSESLRGEIVESALAQVLGQQTEPSSELKFVAGWTMPFGR